MFTRSLYSLAALACLLLLPGIALAQAAAPETPSGSWAAWLASGAATILAVGATWALRSWVGISLDRQAQDSLHRAAETGAIAIAKRLGFDVRIDDAIGQVRGYVAASVPDALMRLAPSDRVLDELIASKLPILVGPAAPQASSAGGQTSGYDTAR